MRRKARALALSVALLPSIAIGADDPPPAADKTVAEHASEAGAIVSREAKAVGKAVKEDAVQVAHAARKGAIKVGHAAKEGAAEVADGARRGAQKVKAAVTKDPAPDDGAAPATASPTADPH